MASLLAVAVLVLAIDQATKAVARRPAGRVRFGWHRGAVIRPWANRGVARPFGPRELLGLWLVAAAAALLLVAAGAGPGAPPAPIALGAILGGAAGNLRDLRRHGAVRDFLDLGLGVFNLADVAVVAGLAAMLALVLLRG
jgi:lipoprotein signal peptidase